MPIEIIDNMVMPKTVKRRTRNTELYPFNKLKVGQGFIVPAEKALWKIGKLKNGEKKRSSAVHSQASYLGKRDGKRFQCVTNEDSSISVKRIA